MKKLQKKRISKIKKHNINLNKLQKRGEIRKESRKQKRKEKRKENRKNQILRLENFRREKNEKELEDDVTGEDMMEMMAADDVEELLKMHENGEKKEVRKEMKRLLPIRTEEGWQEREVEITKEEHELELTKYKRPVKKAKVEEPDEEEVAVWEGQEGEEDEVSSDHLDEEEGPSPTKRSVAEILAQRRRKLHDKKVKMACLATNLIENPGKAANMWVLLQILLESDPSSEVTIQRYCCLTILELFNNLIPSYRIQEKDLSQRMKKETYQVAKQESDLIKQYQKYLQILEDLIGRLKKEPQNIAFLIMGRTVVHCFGELLVKHPRFNYSMNLIQALIPYLNNRDDEIRKIVYSALTQTIKNDKSCYLTLEIVRKVYKTIQRAKFKVKREALEVFLAVRVHEMTNLDDEMMRKKDTMKQLTQKERLIKRLQDRAKVKPSKKQKRERKKVAKLREGMAQINALEIQNVQNVRHSEILQTIFGIYIHILKKRPNSKLMGIVFNGLGRFAHLINIEFFSDLLSLMNKFLDEGLLSRRDSLNCLQTVFTILSGQGEALNIDPEKFYRAFYTLLMDINAGDLSRNIEVILDIFNKMFLKCKKKVSGQKVNAFVKRLATLATSLRHDLLIPVLLTLKSLLSNFPATEALLDPDPEGAPGTFLPEISDPEHCNASATALWEVHYGLRHYHPTVRLLSTNILSNIPAREVVAVTSLMRRSTEDLLSDFDFSRLKFRPPLPDPDPHLKNFKKRKSECWNGNFRYDPKTKRFSFE